MMRPPRTQSGFSLIELVVVITLLGILGGVVGAIIGNFVGGITTGIGRQETASAGRTAMERMVREIRSGLPNSFRALDGSELNGNDGMAFIRVAWTGRYQAVGANNSDYFQPEDSASTTYEFQAYAPELDPGGADINSNALISIYPVSWPDIQDGASAELQNNVTNCNNGCSIEAIGKLKYHSPGRRIYAAEEWVCVGKVGDKVKMNVADLSTSPGDCQIDSANGSVLVDNLSNDPDSLKFTFDPGNPTRSALVHVELTLQNPSSTDEKLDFVQDIHALNPP